MPASKSLAFSLIVVLTWGFLGCRTKERQDPRTLPELVRVAAVREADQQNRTYTGVVTARIQSELGFRIPGKLKRLVADLSLDRHILQEIVAKKL